MYRMRSCACHTLKDAATTFEIATIAQRSCLAQMMQQPYNTIHSVTSKITLEDTASEGDHLFLYSEILLKFQTEPSSTHTAFFNTSTTRSGSDQAGMPFNTGQPFFKCTKSPTHTAKSLIDLF